MAAAVVVVVMVVVVVVVVVSRTHARTHALTRTNAHARMQRTSRTQLKHSKGVSKKELIEVMTVVDDDNRCTHITSHHNGLDLHTHHSTSQWA
jgi:type II secretory pathway component PulK